jgi:hypothetical protein
MRFRDLFLLLNQKIICCCTFHCRKNIGVLTVNIEFMWRGLETSVIMTGMWLNSFIRPM